MTASLEVSMTKALLLILALGISNAAALSPAATA
jgi:hypothetical protein